ncbi:hypothetical protein EJ03DRAFT_143352 [Teratosphaeria nubilosa]|uniref:Uncharacterized protein n=1 Tax=Teratosphaeria nubilosa TaxID=161662 RepID=A0A6G1L4I4_9PEZI|nr:hypothetical protein EJ03DRAFT_143352 [Teratosphaeria nubilosa]
MHLAAPSSQTQNDGVSVTYRQAKPLPGQLLDQATVCLEEQLYSSAFQFLSSALTSDNYSTRPVQIPLPQHFALAATLSVHPGLTTRSTNKDKHAAADDALRYLDHARKLVGVQQAGFGNAFVYVPKTVQRTNKRPLRSRMSDQHSTDEDEESLTSIRSVYAHEESLWQNAEDFWAVLGWALNCSVVHEARWERWRPFLEFMLDVLEADLDARIRDRSVHESLLATYLSPIGEGRNNKRHLMRSILADGKAKATGEFGEVWRDETKAPKLKREDEAVSGKKRKLDLENEEYGDYFDDSEAEDTTTPSMVAGGRSKRGRKSADATENGSSPFLTAKDELTGLHLLGGISSINIRRRILAALLKYCYYSPTSFVDTEELLDLYTEYIRPLPLAVFQQFTCPAKRWLGPHEQSSLDQMLLRPLISSAAPEYDENKLTQKDLERHYAPFPANTTGWIDNAKVSLLVEDLLRLLWRTDGLIYSKELRSAVTKGVKTRNERAAWDGRNKTGLKAAEDQNAKVILESSGRRMVALLDMLG